MPVNLRNRDFLKELDFTTAEMQFLLDLSRDLKRAKYTGNERQRMQRKNVALIFERPPPAPGARSRSVPTTRAPV